ncbi:MAG: hypothetical protein PVF33_00045 [Candidatus Latescibacterota bacterium]|jgi:hypothetical protein
MSKKTVILAAAALLGLAFCGAASAESQGEAARLARTIQNPIANLITLPFQYNYNGGVGQYDRKSLDLFVQPVIPFHGDKWNVITRTIIPVKSVPTGITGSVFGFGDINLNMFLSPVESANPTWGAGVAMYLPTASNPELLGTGQFSLGPTGVVFYSLGKVTMGFVANNVWSVAGDSDRSDVNFLFFQYFANYNLGGGWAVGTVPIVTANWMADSGEEWSVPWGAQVSKVTQFGKRPVNLLVGYYYYSDHPTGAADYQVRLQLNLLYPETR